MDSEGDFDADDFANNYFAYDVVYDDYDDTYESKVKFMVGVVRVPLILLQTMAATLQNYRRLRRAWMLAIAKRFPDTSLRKLRSKYPSLLPPWLLRGFETYKDVLVLRHGGIFAQEVDRRRAAEVVAKSPSVLAATSNCRFREGFAAEGMLCNDPPIPLRVLDFLEHAEDLINLALVCKATHQAGHVLLRREFPGGAVPDVRAMAVAIERRKRSMLESALRHPITCSTGPASTMAALTEPEAGSGADAEEMDHVYADIHMTVEMDKSRWQEVDWCMLVLLWANKVATAGPSVRMPPHPSLKWLLRKRAVAAEWRVALDQWLGEGIVMDAEAVGRAVAHWAELNIKDPDRSNARAATDAEHVMRVLRAAQRHGQGVIVHPGCMHA